MRFLFECLIRILILAVAIGGKPWRIADPRPFCELRSPEKRPEK